jgi:hypothetical protein
MSILSIVWRVRAITLSPRSGEQPAETQDTATEYERELRTRDYLYPSDRSVVSRPVPKHSGSTG